MDFERISEVSETIMCVTEGTRRFQGVSKLFQVVSENFSGLQRQIQMVLMAFQGVLEGLKGSTVFENTL